MAVAVSGVQVEVREVVLRDKPSEMLAASPKATVPVLVLPRDEVFDQSLDIMRWALELSDPEDWLAHDDSALIAANDGPFKQSLDKYKYPHRYELADGIEHRNAGFGHLSRLNEILATTAYFGGSRPRLTDIALFPFVRQFAATDPDWFAAQRLPRLQNWLTKLVHSERFAQIMLRYPQWHAGDTPVLFP
jgi:glutathione S-transferase